MRTYQASRPLIYASGLATAAGFVVLAASCGGGSDDAKTETPAAIDSAGVTSAIADFGGFGNVCTNGAAALSAKRRTPVTIMLSQSLKIATRNAIPQSKGRLALGSTPPPDELGDCGGRMGYRNYSHLSGTTTATLAFEDYCSLDADTGGRQIVNGAIAFVNTGTPSASGPITSQLTADTTTPVVVTERDAGGVAVNTQTLNFTGFKMAVGVPGGSPTAANPDVMTLTSLSSTDSASGKVYRQSNWRLTQFETASGGSQASFSGRGYRSSGAYFDITTPQPVIQDADGDTVSGQLRFDGANGSYAVATMVPGPTMQVTLSVNGVPVTSGVPACSTSP